MGAPVSPANTTFATAEHGADLSATLPQVSVRVRVRVRVRAGVGVGARLTPGRVPTLYLLTKVRANMMSLDAARYSSGLSCAAAIARGGGVRALFLGLTYAAYHP